MSVTIGNHNEQKQASQDLNLRKKGYISATETKSALILFWLNASQETERCLFLYSVA